MATVRVRAWVAAPVERVFAFFDDPANLARLMPPPVRIEVERVEPMPIRAGTIVDFRYGLGPIRRTWTIRFVDHVPNERIVDETLVGPIARFHHQHSFAPAGRGGTWIEDRIDFHVGPDGPVGAIVDAVAAVVMRLTFVWRHARQRQLLRE